MSTSKYAVGVHIQLNRLDVYPILDLDENDTRYNSRAEALSAFHEWLDNGPTRDRFWIAYHTFANGDTHCFAISRDLLYSTLVKAVVYEVVTPE